MKFRGLYFFLSLMAGAVGLQAQDYKGNTDTLKVQKPLPAKGISAFFGTSLPKYSDILTPYYLYPAYDRGESKEQRAARINMETFNSSMLSIRQNLSWYRPPKLSNTAKNLLSIGTLFLTNPFKYPKGTIPVMNTSNPFLFAYVPGMAPYDYPYSPDYFPQCIRLEYDSKTGTYKQVMVKWNEVIQNIAISNERPFMNEAIPRMRVHSTDDLIP